MFTVHHMTLGPPLTSILGLVNLASKTENKDEIQNYLDMIENRVDTMKNFIAEIIDYSRNTRLNVAVDKINLHDLVKDVIVGLEYFEKSSKINFIIEIPESQIIHSDRGRLKIILNNLISNAIKYHNFRKNETLNTH